MCECFPDNERGEGYETVIYILIYQFMWQQNNSKSCGRITGGRGGGFFSSLVHAGTILHRTSYFGNTIYHGSGKVSAGRPARGITVSRLLSRCRGKCAVRVLLLALSLYRFRSMWRRKPRAGFARMSHYVPEDLNCQRPTYEKHQDIPPQRD